MLDAIIKRRSIRKYKEEEIPVHMVEEVLRAGLLAPSSKNRQPWKFIVVTGRSKAEMLEVFRQGLEREKKSPLLPEDVYKRQPQFLVQSIPQFPQYRSLRIRRQHPAGYGPGPVCCSGFSLHVHHTAL